ncbi:MAG: outer membrane protein assembly factor BamA [Kiritimatiellaeota bacterium]|nr:outer membrane protein assembly factor BamA [Kiritimatiellota bacterium]
MSHKTFSTVILTIAAVAATAQSARNAAPRIDAIEVVSEKGERIEDAYVKAHTALHEGAEFDAEAVATDVRTLLDSGRFSYVGSRVVETNGAVRLAFVVERRTLVVGEVQFSGVGFWHSSKKVREAYGLKAGSFVDAHVIAAAEERVLKLFREKHNYPNAKIVTTVKPAGDGKGGAAQLAVSIDPGAPIGVAFIGFTGNNSISSRELRRFSGQSPWWNPSGWFTTERVTDMDLELMKSDITRQYHDRGMLDARIAGPHIGYADGWKLIGYEIEEGPVYKIGTVELKGVTLFPEEEILAGARLRRGDIASAGAIERARAAIEGRFTSRGHTYTRVATFFYADEERPGVLNVVFSVSEGALMHVGNILIRGNTITKDKVIRREIALNPGDVYDGVAADLSRRRLQNLGYFENVRSYDVRTGADDVRDLVFDMDETSTGQMMFGAGYSSVDHMIGFFEISQSNFDFANPWSFRGGGQKARLNMQISSDSTDVEANWTEPWLFDHRLALDVNAFVRNRSFGEYDERRIGGSVGLSRLVPWVGRVGLSYSLQDVSLRRVMPGDFELADSPGKFFRFTDEKDSYLLGSLRLTWSYDTRDRFMIPTSGTRATFAGTLNSRALGGDIDFYELNLNAQHHIPLWYGHVLTFAGHLAVSDGFNGDDVPISSRHFLGGGRNVRGFRYRNIGPKALYPLDATASDPRLGTIYEPQRQGFHPIGGRSAFDASAEYTIPVGNLIRLAAFYDIGNVYNDAFEFDFTRYASSAGGGIRLDIPGFPLRFDYAVGLTKDDDHTRKRAFVFWVGF